MCWSGWVGHEQRTGFQQKTLNCGYQWRIYVLVKEGGFWVRVSVCQRHPLLGGSGACPPLGNVWNIGAFSCILGHLLTNFRDSEKEFSAHTSVFHWNYSSALCWGMVGGIPSRKIDNSMQQCSALTWYRPIQILWMGKSLAAHGLGWHSRHYQCGDYDKAWTEAWRVLFTVVTVWNKTLSTTLILFTFLLVLEKKAFGQLPKGGVQPPPVDPPVATGHEKVLMAQWSVAWTHCFHPLAQQICQSGDGAVMGTPASPIKQLKFWTSTIAVLKKLRWMWPSTRICSPPGIVFRATGRLCSLALFQKLSWGGHFFSDPSTPRTLWIEYALTPRTSYPPSPTPRTHQTPPHRTKKCLWPTHPRIISGTALTIVRLTFKLPQVSTVSIDLDIALFCMCWAIGSQGFDKLVPGSHFSLHLWLWPSCLQQGDCGRSNWSLGVGCSSSVFEVACSSCHHSRLPWFLQAESQQTTQCQFTHTRSSKRTKSNTLFKSLKSLVYIIQEEPNTVIP